MVYFLPVRNRRRNRLKHYDYSRNGYYFVTICTQNRMWDFGGIKNGEMVLNDNGVIVRKRWKWLAKQYQYVGLDEFVVMPNHLHGIVIIDGCNNNVGTGRDLSLRETKIKSLSELVGAFKTTSSKIIRLNGLVDFCWQRSFYDHIIRNDKSLCRIKRYIYE